MTCDVLLKGGHPRKFTQRSKHLLLKGAELQKDQVINVRLY